MTKPHLDRFRQFFVGTFSLMGMLIVGALVLLWSWNSVADGLIQLPAMEYKHALAVELFLLVLFLITVAGAKLLMRGQHLFYSGGRW